jgi:hypothetical protein
MPPVFTNGARPGHVFKNGDQGVGYYADDGLPAPAAANPTIDQPPPVPVLPRRIARRPAPANTHEGPQFYSGRNFMNYGPGHRGFVSGYSFGGPASHKHIPAIEVALHHPKIGEVPYTLMGMNVPLSEVLHTFLEDAGIETPDEYALEYNGTRIFDAEASPLSLGLDPFTEWPAAVLEVVEVGTRRIASSLLALNRLGTALAIARSGTAEQHAHLADADALAQVFGLLDLDDLLSVSKVCALWHVVSQRVSLLYQLQCSAPPTVEYPAYLSLLSELSTLLDADACRARAAEHSQWAILRLSKELSYGASGGGHSGGGHSGGRRNRSRGLRWDRPSICLPRRRDARPCGPSRPRSITTS